MKRYTLCSLIFLIFIFLFQLSFAKNNPLDLFYIQKIYNGQLDLQQQSRGILSFSYKDKELLSFNTDSVQKLSGFVNLKKFLEVFKSKHDTSGLNSVLVLKNKKAGFDVILLSLSKPSSDNQKDTITYHALLLTQHTLNPAKIIKFSQALLMYDPVCVSCAVGG